MHKGFLITLEGGEGVGKTTQVAHLERRFQTAGIRAITVREPGGTLISEQIRTVVLAKNNYSMADTTEVLLFQAARAQIYQELVIPALKEGKIVLMDRSRDSSVVYQGMVRGFGRKLIEQLNDISTKKTIPDLTLLLDAPIEIGLRRSLESGETNRLEQENGHFHRGVRQGYLGLAKENENKRWEIVDVTQSAAEVEGELWRIITERLKAANFALPATFG
jgi:dTMP kinase